jgi:hypothetical protein
LPVTSVTGAVASGDRRASLEALRRLLAERIEAGVRARDLAALSLQLMKVLRELDETPRDLRGGRRRR